MQTTISTNAELEVQTQSPNTQKFEHSDELLLAIAQQTMSNKDFDLYTKIHDDYQQQPIDDDWSPSYENQLLTMFSADHSLDNITLTQVACKSTLCELSIDAPQQNSMNVMEQISKVLAKQAWRDPEAAIVFNSENQQDGIMKVYLGRDQNSLLSVLP